MLERYVSQHSSGAAECASVHLVAFPYTKVPSDWSAVDCPRSAVIDSHDLAEAAGRVINAIRQQGEGRPALTELGLDVLVTLIGGQLAGQT